MSRVYGGARRFGLLKRRPTAGALAQVVSRANRGQPLSGGSGLITICSGDGGGSGASGGRSGRRGGGS
jgi:hypothetical protein